MVEETSMLFDGELGNQIKVLQALDSGMVGTNNVLVSVRDDTDIREVPVSNEYPPDTIKLTELERRIDEGPELDGGGTNGRLMFE